MRFLLLLSFLLTVLVSPAATIRGRVTGGKAGEALPGAVVVVQGTSLSAPTDANGRYEIRDVPAGRYAVKVSFVGYREETKTVVVSEATPVVLDFALQEAAQSLGNVVVTGKLNQEEENASRLSERTADNIINVISSKTIERSPDINAANVLTRVSGINLQRSTNSNGAYAVIRGMEPRYNNTLVNGVKIPSPDGQNRFISLDIVPSDLLKRIEVTKSLVPSLEGDATGGTVNLVMKDAPDTTLFRATASIGYSQLFFDRKYESFSQADIQQQSPGGRYGADYAATQQDFSRSNLKALPKQAPPTYLAGLTFGHRYLRDRLGVLVALNTQNQYFGSNGVFNTVANSLQNQPSLVNIVAPRNFSNHQINNGLVAHLDFTVNERNKLAFDNLLLRSDFSQLETAVDTSLTDQRRGPGTGTIKPLLQTHTTRQILENAKFSGRHELNSRLLFDWAGVVSVATSNSPDYATLNTDYALSPTADGQIHRSIESVDTELRVWQHNRDRDYTGLANLAYQTSLFKHALELKVGGLYRAKNRYNLQDEYNLRGGLINGFKQVFTGIDNAQFTVYTPLGTAGADAANYTATENVGAGYAQAKWELGPLQVLTGVRLESTQQAFTTVQISSVSTLPSGIAKSYQDFLPSLNLRYLLSERQNLRFSYFASINRPNYYELVPYYNYSAGTVGNPNLRRATADNLDLRYEIYPTSENYFTVGVFYKRIVDPIELKLDGLTAGQIFRQPQNNPTPATNLGAEVTFTKYIQHFGLSGNYTYTHSVISDHQKFFNNTVTGYTEFVTQDRPLQSQANHIANLSLLFRDRPTGFYAQLSYQYTGRILQLVGQYFDYYQRPLSSLAFSVDKRITRHFTAFAKLNNLLNTKTILTVNQSDLVLQQDAFKATYLLGMRYAL